MHCKIESIKYAVLAIYLLMFSQIFPEDTWVNLTAFIASSLLGIVSLLLAMRSPILEDKESLWK